MKILGSHSRLGCMLMFEEHCCGPVALSPGFVFESPEEFIKTISVWAPAPRASESFHLGLGVGIRSFKSSPGDTKAQPESRTTAVKATPPPLTGKKCCPN